MACTECSSSMEQPPSRVVLFLLTASTPLLPRFSTPPLTISFPDFPSDSKAAAGSCGGGFQLCIGRDFKHLALAVMDRTAHLVTASVSVKVLPVYTEHPLCARHCTGHLSIVSAFNCRKIL